MTDTETTIKRTSQNPVRHFVREGKVYDGDTFDEVDLVTPGHGQTEEFDSESEEATAKAGSGGLDLDKPVEDMTHAELDAYAAQEDIDLAGATTRQDKIDKINAS